MKGFGEQKEKKKKRPQKNSQISGKRLLKNAIKYHIQGDLKNAEKTYRAAINSGLLNAALFSNLGTICQISQRTEEAIDLYKRAIQINSIPRSPHQPGRHLQKSRQPWSLLLSLSNHSSSNLTTQMPSPTQGYPQRSRRLWSGAYFYPQISRAQAW